MIVTWKVTFDIPTGEFQISVSSGNATLKFTERWL